MAEVPNTIIHFFTVEGYEFGLRPPDIECMDCSKIWCVHVQALYQQNRDAHAIWDKPENTYVREELPLTIPVFPSGGFWTTVHLVRTELPHSVVYSVVWDNPPDSRYPILPFLCYLNPGEGRKVIRDAIVEFWQADYDGHKKCIAAHHGYHAERVLDNAKGTNSEWFEKWSIYTTGWCRNCLATFSVNDPDLVPVPEKNVWNS